MISVWFYTEPIRGGLLAYVTHFWDEAFYRHEEQTFEHQCRHDQGRYRYLACPPKSATGLPHSYTSAIRVLCDGVASDFQPMNVIGLRLVTRTVSSAYQ